VDLREAAAEDADDLARLVDRKGRLGDVGDLRVAGQRERLGLGHVLDEHGCIGRLPHRPDDLLVARMADQDDGVPVRRVAPRLDVHLRHERAGRIDDVVAAGRRRGVHGRCDPVRGVDDRRALRRLLLGVDEDRATGFELADDVDVVDDLLPHVDRRAVVLERELHRLDGTLDARAVAARRRQEDTLDHETIVAARRENSPAASGGSSRQGRFQCSPRVRGSHRPVRATLLPRKGYSNRPVGPSFKAASAALSSWAAQ
jgi:hypothetical protein